MSNYAADIYEALGETERAANLRHFDRKFDHDHCDCTAEALEEKDAEHWADIASRDEEIRELRAQVKKAEAAHGEPA